MTNTNLSGNDPFVHLPHLRGRFIPPLQSKARVTPEVLAQWDQRVFALGGDPSWRLPDEEREAARRIVMADERHAGDVWVFAYGSLMWDPAIYFSEVRLAELAGYQRCFNYQVIAGRGTPEQPGLVLSLMPERGRCCRGLAFRIPKEQVQEETTLLWRREMLRGGYAPETLALDTPQGVVQAIVFVAHVANAAYMNDLSLDETAQIVAAAAGHLGTNRDYLVQLAAQLQALDIGDSYIENLHQAVAEL